MTDLCNLFNDEGDVFRSYVLSSVIPKLSVGFRIQARMVISRERVASIVVEPHIVTIIEQANGSGISGIIVRL